MIRSLSRMAVSVAMLGLVAALTGCDSNRIKDERDALYTQNQELQAKYTDSQRALDAANAQLHAQNVAPAAPTPETPPAEPPVAEHTTGHSGFHAIHGVETDESVAGQVTVRVPGDVLFASGKADLKGDSKKTLMQIASVLKKEYPGKHVRVEGFTDTDPIKHSKWKDNMELSEARAKSVAHYLEEAGISSSHITTHGYGDAQPRATKAESRRVEIVVMVANK